MSSNRDRARLIQYVIENIVNYLDSCDLAASARTLERESGHFFNVKHFMDLFTNSKFNEAEKYLKGFISIHDNEISALTFFEIRKQKLLFTLHAGDKKRAMMLVKRDFEEFEPYGCGVAIDAAQLVNLDKLRRHPMMKNYRNPQAELRIARGEMRNYLESNPKLLGKLVTPNMAQLNSSAPVCNAARTASYPAHPNDDITGNFRIFDGFHAAPYSDDDDDTVAEDDDENEDEVLGDASDENDGSSSDKSA